MRRSFFSLVALASMATVALLAAPVDTDAAVLQAPATSFVRGASLIKPMIKPITFWAKPYPNGYSGWRRCRKHRVLVEGPTGPRWRRICI